MAKIGDQISAGNCVVVTSIDDIAPVKYNGIDDTYDICLPAKATHYVIITNNNDYMVISSNCINKEALIDIL